LQDRPKFTQIKIFGLKNILSGNPETGLVGGGSSVEKCDRIEQKIAILRKKENCSKQVLKPETYFVKYSKNLK
jgi:hypothetical protein